MSRGKPEDPFARPVIPPEFRERMNVQPHAPQQYPPQYQPANTPQWQAPQPFGQYPIAARNPQMPRRKRRVFLWVFLAVQALFMIWLISGIATTGHSGADAHAQAVQWCSSKGNWQYLYSSQADCVTHYGNGLNDASDVGKGIGVGIVIALWVAVDFFLGLGYGIYRLASRR